MKATFLDAVKMCNTVCGNCKNAQVFLKHYFDAVNLYKTVVEKKLFLKLLKCTNLILKEIFFETVKLHKSICAKYCFGAVNV